MAPAMHSFSEELTLSCTRATQKLVVERYVSPVTYIFVFHSGVLEESGPEGIKNMF